MFCSNLLIKGKKYRTSFSVKSVPRLNSEQELTLRVMQTGHNALITRKAGTGQTFLVQEIFRSLIQSGKRVRIVCSNGIAGTVYIEMNASTVHSQYAFDAILYLRLVDVKDKAYCSFLMEKSGLVHIKPMNVARLELSAAVLAVQLDKTLK